MRMRDPVWRGSSLGLVFIASAIGFRTDRTVWKQLVGTGPLSSNQHAGLHRGLDGTIYVGVGRGVVALRDGR